MSFQYFFYWFHELNPIRANCKKFWATAELDKRTVRRQKNKSSFFFCGKIGKPTEFCRAQCQYLSIVYLVAGLFSTHFQRCHLPFQRAQFRCIIVVAAGVIVILLFCAPIFVRILQAFDVNWFLNTHLRR